ncbi:hypothetical protein I4U23_006950 [Adineta vaga]|nr:hypothetical protein I4U23_006950 [Adineta vaga]
MKLMSDKQAYKIGLWIGVCLLLVTFICIYMKSVMFSQSKIYPTQDLLINRSLTHATAWPDTKAKSPDENQILDDMPKEAFVTYIDNSENYRDLLAQLLISIHHFSTRPVIAYGFNIDLNFDTKKYPRLIQRRLNRSDCGESIFFCKIHAIIESKLDYGVQIDADSVVNWNIDLLFDVVRRWPHPFPLAPRHPDDPKNYKTFLKTFDVDIKTRITPYIHAQFSWNYRAYPFFNRTLRLMREGNFVGANFDETAVNILLWKARVNHTLCKIDPYASFISDYETQSKTCKEYCHTAFMIMHGSKKASDAYHILKRLKKLRGLPFVQTREDGFHYLNETQYTCCYPDSQPSPIHPLICEYSQPKS